jgi:integrase
LEVRDREYLFEEEVKAMIQVAFKGRWGHRDSTLILMGYRHGLRISELVNLRWQQINFNTGHIHVRRVKGSRPSVHPLSAEEMRALRQLPPINLKSSSLTTQRKNRCYKQRLCIRPLFKVELSKYDVTSNC